MQSKDGRIIKGVGGLYSVNTEDGIFDCGARGIFRNTNQTPTTGDFVSISVLDEKGNKGIIEDIKERKNFLVRPRVANVDQGVIVFTLKKPAVPVDLLDRFILLAENAELEVIICINKIDLAEEKAEQKIKSIYEGIGYDVVSTSAANGIGLPRLRELLENRVSVFAGPSGVGKSSLINLLLPDTQMKTGALSVKISRGKHTTRHTELLKSRDNTFVVDSPGFSSLSLEDVVPKEDLHLYFREFRPYLGKCRFSDCRHLNEPDCAVKEQVGIDINTERYLRYVEFYGHKGVL